MKKISVLLFLGICFMPSSAQQISIDRIDKMPDFPQPYSMKDWKAVTRNYDSFVFDLSKKGEYLPLITLDSVGYNYPNEKQMYLDTYVGSATHGTQAEAINIMPAIIGASLIGIDKSNQHGENWVSMMKNYFNRKNGTNIYLNSFSNPTGKDWWYELMPSVFFYQLRSLYPDLDPDFEMQFRSVADRELKVVYQMGGKTHPWTLPNMNYRAFNLETGKPRQVGVIEPESAGSVAWLLYQAYMETGDKKYYEGARLSMDFLCNLKSNPSYELQLPYGTLIAARMNAEQGLNYPIGKLLNWCFERGDLRLWGSSIGRWNGYDVAGLIGEANDAGNDYEFVMNGFQQAAALTPLVKYDKQYARAIGKWLLNVSNASRLFYPKELPAVNQESASLKWSLANDPLSCIPYESMKELWKGKSPLAMGDALGGKWAETNLSLYSGSSVGYLGCLIQTTDVEGILQIDANKTDFYAKKLFPVYLCYNPYSTTKIFTLTLPSTKLVDIYDAISEKIIARKVSSTCALPIPSSGVLVLTVLPSGTKLSIKGNQLKADNHIIDYHCTSSKMIK